jgi:hypothetical protein
MSEPHRVRARVERVPVLAIALGGAIILCVECAIKCAIAAFGGDAATGATTLRGVEVFCFLGGPYSGASYGALVPMAFVRGFWAGLLFAGTLEVLARLSALRVTVAFDEEGAK